MNKICTSIEQSKKFIELGIDVNTADMYYPNRVSIDNLYYPKRVGKDNYVLPIVWKNGHPLLSQEIPCWSLTALLCVLPDEVGDNHYLTLNKEGKEYCCCYEDNNGNSFRHTFADNPVDACVEMVIKLHELKRL